VFFVIKHIYVYKTKYLKGQVYADMLDFKINKIPVCLICLFVVIVYTP